MSCTVFEISQYIFDKGHYHGYRGTRAFRLGGVVFGVSRSPKTTAAVWGTTLVNGHRHSPGLPVPTWAAR
jgi:hypothetical protein